MTRTSHVGSFPLPYSSGNLDRVINDLWRIGIDAPPYPQLRSFIDIYLQPLADEGILRSRGGFYFLDSREKITQLKDFEARIPEAEYFAEMVKGSRIGFKWLRGPVTGVFTLASRIYTVDDVNRGLYATLLRDHSALEHIVGYVHRMLKYLHGLGYNVLFIDEPVLGVIVGKRRILLGYTEEEIKNVINNVYDGIGGEHGIHVCGRISPRLFKLLSGTESIDILNFEFHDNPLNIEFIDQGLLEENDKILAPGVASSKNPVVESMEEIRGLLLRIRERAGDRIDLVSADCGFGGLSVEDGDPYKAYMIGIEKLRRIKRVVEELDAVDK